MAYGILKVDTITFTDGGVDKSVPVSGLVQNPTFTGNITATGTISGNIIQGGTTVSGVTVTGTTANFASGVFTTQISGVTVIATTGTFTSLTGTTTNGTTASFTTGNFTSLTGTTTTGTTANFASGVFTTQISGVTVIATTGTFTSLTGTTTTMTSGVFASGTALLPSISFVSDPNTGIYSPGADQLAVATNGAGRLFVDASGNISAGTSPATILGKTVNVYGGSSEGASVVLQANNGSEFCTLFSGPTAADPFALISKSGFKFATASAADATGYSEKLRITSAGLVGIGTSSAQRLLDARGSVNLSTTAPTVSAIGYADIHLRTFGGATNSPARITVVDSFMDFYTTFTDGFRWFNWSSDGVAAQRMTLDSSGRLGIGTTTVVYNLQVAGSDPTIAINATNASASSVSTLLYRNVDGNGNTRNIASIEGESTSNGGYGALAFHTAFNNSLNERFRCDADGRLLIGTTSHTGANLLQVNSDALINGITVGRGLASISTNTAVGSGALSDNTTGSNNTANGFQALYFNTTGSSNTANGQYALYNCSTGSGNCAFGGVQSNGAYLPPFAVTTHNDRVVIGSQSTTNAYIQVAWTVTSDARDKTNFAPVPHGLDFVNALKPTAFQFKFGRDSDKVNGPVRYGFKAQDILALEGQDSVIIDNEDPEKLRYNGEALVPVLVNAIKELSAKNTALEARLTAAGID